MLAPTSPEPSNKLATDEKTPENSASPIADLEPKLVELLQSSPRPRPVSAPDLSEIVSLFRVDSFSQSKGATLRRAQSDNYYRNVYGAVGPFIDYSSSSSESEADDMTKQMQEMEERHLESQHSFARAAQIWLEERQTLMKNKTQLEEELQLKQNEIESMQKQLRHHPQSQSSFVSLHASPKMNSNGASSPGSNSLIIDDGNVSDNDRTSPATVRLNPTASITTSLRTYLFFILTTVNCWTHLALVIMLINVQQSLYFQLNLVFWIVPYFIALGISVCGVGLNWLLMALTLLSGNMYASVRIMRYHNKYDVSRVDFERFRMQQDRVNDFLCYFPRVIVYVTYLSLRGSVFADVTSLTVFLLVTLFLEIMDRHCTSPYEGFAAFRKFGNASSQLNAPLLSPEGSGSL